MSPKIHTINLWWLVVIAAIFAVLGFGGTLLTYRLGWPTPGLPYTTMITLAILIVVLLVLGLRVRSWRNGKREKSINLILAARTLVLAQASAYGGALIFGWHVGVFIDAVAAFIAGAPLSSLLPTLALMGSALAVIATGLIVERFCRIPPEDENMADDSRTPGEEGFA